MSFSFYPRASPLSRHSRLHDLVRVESRSPLPAFKNLGRGVF
jgi:hypothetical protein